jgi:hypothetical protein
MKFFARMLTVFFALARPDSTMAKPKFMKNTRKAATSTHRVSIATLKFMIPSLRILSLVVVKQGACQGRGGVN